MAPIRRWSKAMAPFDEHLVERLANSGAKYR